jgi:hypothetical protein
MSAGEHAEMTRRGWFVRRTSRRAHGEARRRLEGGHERAASRRSNENRGHVTRVALRTCSQHNTHTHTHTHGGLPRHTQQIACGNASARRDGQIRSVRGACLSADDSLHADTGPSRVSASRSDIARDLSLREAHLHAGRIPQAHVPLNLPLVPRTKYSCMAQTS